MSDLPKILESPPESCGLGMTDVELAKLPKASTSLVCEMITPAVEKCLVPILSSLAMLMEITNVTFETQLAPDDDVRHVLRDANKVAQVMRR